MARSPRLDYYTLEGFDPSEAPAQVKGLAVLRRGWSAFWTGLLDNMAGTREPVIKLCRDRQGHSYYLIYDPTTEQRMTCDSRAEVLAWIEQRYRV